MRVFFIKFLIFLTIALPLIGQAAEPTDITLFFKDHQGRNVGFYTGSYALLIGVSDYRDTWPDLKGIPGQLERIEFALEQHGFKIEKVLNPNGEQIKKAFELFIKLYGRDKNNRLLFFFCGHGYAGKQGKKAYLVPADAPDPGKDEKDFLNRSLDVEQVLSWSRHMQAKHALFIFDSCLSDTMFEAITPPEYPPHISSVTSRAVRQFITAGSAGEEVPAMSVFTLFFARALKGEADFNNDGYVTGTELGMYLHDKILNYVPGQTPRYGKSKDPDLDKGDFIFQVIGSPESEEALLSCQTSNPEFDMWQLVKKSMSTEDIIRFLATFPDGQFSKEARLKLERMEQGHTEAEKYIAPAEDAEASRVAALESNALFAEGKGYYDDGNYEEALKRFRKAAEQGHTEADKYIALSEDAEASRVAALESNALFAEGKGYYDDGNYEEALKRFRRAAEQGHTEADKHIALSEDAEASRMAALESNALFAEGKGYYDDGNYEEALKRFRRAAEQGHTEADKHIALSEDAEASRMAALESNALFAEGKGYYDDGNYEEALKRFRRVAEQGHTEAQNYVGLIYDSGRGVTRDEKEAMKWFRKAAEQGDADAQNYIGLMYDSGRGVIKNEREAMKWFHMSAEQGHASAQYNLGMQYFEGDDVDKDYDEALKWFRKAAEQGHADAQNYVGLMYDIGRGVTEDEWEAVKWFRRAAEQGHRFAQYNLGMQYFEGDDVDKDYDEALKWFRRAAEQEYPDAQNYIGLMYDSGRGVMSDEWEAVKWFRRAAEQGHKSARYNLGIQYYEGDEIDKDYDEALKWFRRAAEQGHAGAQNYIGLMYDAGRGVARDEREAVKWFRRAAEQGHSSAQYNTGIQYYEGDEIDKDYDEALKWFRRAAEQGHAGAQKYIGIMYGKGLAGGN